MARPPLHPDLEHLPPKEQRRRNECVLWRGPVDRLGYGRDKVRCDDGVWRSRYVHRLDYELVYGPLADGERVYRTCGEKLCLNQFHMTTDSGGRPPSRAKLTARKAQNIRDLWASEDRPTQAEIARRYGVSRSAISLVVNGVTWRSP